MSKLKVNVPYKIFDGSEVIFYAPCNSSEVESLKILYLENGAEKSKEFTLKDGAGIDLLQYANVFVEGALVKVILDVTNSVAFIQNSAKATPVSETLTYTLLANKWSNGYYVFTQYPDDEYDIEIALDGLNCTASQKEAFDNAEITGCFGYQNSNAIKVWGEVPTVNIPIMLRAVKK